MTTAHFTARPRRRQIMLTPEVSKEVKRLFSAYLHNDQLQIENSLKMLEFWDDLQMLADTDGAGRGPAYPGKCVCEHMGHVIE